MKFLFLFSYILLLHLIFTDSARTITRNHDDPISLSYITVLLPKRVHSHSAYPVTVHLEGFGEGGCFNWETNLPQVLEVEPSSCSEGSRCEHVKCKPGSSPAVLLRAVHSASTGRKSAWVWAEEVHSGHRAECEVFIDCIHKLSLLTSTKVINVGDVEAISVQGFDSNGNVFTSLEGITFLWLNNGTQIVDNVLLSEGLVAVTPNRIALEKLGLGSDIYLGRGIKTGRAEISAQLLDARCDGVVSSNSMASLLFSVVEPIHLTPAFYIMPLNCDVTFVLSTRVRDPRAVSTKQVAIPLPSSQYSWNVTNSTVLQPNEEPWRFVANSPGFCKVVVTDVNLPQHKKEAEVHVSVPHRLAISLLNDDESPVSRPCGPSFIVRNTTYILVIQMLDIEGRIMDICSGVKYDVTFNGTILPEYSFLSRSKIVIKALRTHFFSVTTSLNSISDYPLSNPLSIVENYNVVEPLQVKPSLLVLPSPIKPTYGTFTATGGTGSLKWHHLVPSVATCTNGIVKANSEGVGSVDVLDRCVPENRMSVDILVTKPSELHFIQGAREFQVGDQLPLILSISDSQGHAFSNCSQIELTVDPPTSLSSSVGVSDISSQASAFINQSTCHSSCIYTTGSLKLSCWILMVKTSQQSFFSIRASISSLYGLSPHRNVAETTISSYNPLIVKPYELFIAVNSVRCLSWYGGPAPWPDTKSVISVLKSDSPHLVKITNMASESKDFFNSTDISSSHHSISEADRIKATISCTEVHNETLMVTVQNVVSSFNPFPVTVSVPIFLACYPRISIASKQLTTGIGSSFKLAISDHPLKSFLNFSSDNDVVTPNEQGFVRGNRIGVSAVHAYFPTHSLSCPFDTDDGLHDTATVLVQFGAFIIRSPTDHFLKNERICFHLEDEYGTKPSDSSFSLVEATWSGSSIVDLVSPLDSYISVSDQVNTVTGYSACAFGRSVGKANILAKITVKEPKLSFFEASLQLSVFEPLILISPSSVLLPIGVHYSIITSLDHIAPLTYEIIVSSNDSLSLISITSEGKIIASNIIGDCVVIIRDHISHQSVSLSVSIRPISQVALIPHSPLSSSAICNGQNFTFDIVARDEVGHLFDSLDGWSNYSHCFLNTFSSNNSIVLPSLIFRPKSQSQFLAILSVSAFNEGSATILLSFIGCSHNITFFPLTATINVINTTSCYQSHSIRISMKLSFSLLFSDTRIRHEFINDLKDDISRALSIPSKRMNVVRIDPREQVVIFDLLSSVTPPSSLILAEEFRTQIQDPASLLRRGQITSRYDTHSPISIGLIDSSLNLGIDAPSSLEYDSVSWSDIMYSNISSAIDILNPSLATSFNEWLSTSSAYYFLLVSAIVILIVYLSPLIFEHPISITKTSEPENPLLLSGPGSFNEKNLKRSRIYDDSKLNMSTSSITFHQ